MEFNYLAVVFAPFIAYLATVFILLIENLFAVKLNSKLSAVLVVGFTSFASALALKLFILKAFLLKNAHFWYTFKFSNWIVFTETGYFSQHAGPFALKWGLCFD